MIDDLHQQQQLAPSKEVSDLMDILSSNVMFPKKPFTYRDLEPDLIIKWDLPDPKKEKCIRKVDYQNISAFMSTVSPSLEKAFELCEKKIMKQMEQNQQNDGTTQVKFRYMQSINQLKEPVPHHNTIIMDQSTQDIELMCFNQKMNRLDGFTLYYNAISYILQTICGFRVRSFLINSQQEQTQGFLGMIQKMGLDLVPNKQVRSIYMFLNLSLDNMLRVATRYSIKKQIDYSIFDFHLNDPTTYDQRPIRFNSQFREDKVFRSQMQNVQRFFHIRESTNITTELIDEAKLSLLQYQQFINYWQASYMVFNFLKTRVAPTVKPQENTYIYQHNRRKINPGCERLYTVLTEKQVYYELQKQICQDHGYQFHEEPAFFGDFIRPGKNIKGGFFAKLRSILKYKPENANPYGDLVLFNSMERTKLCYLMLKSFFKMNHLKGALNLDVFALNNNFEKFGEGGQNQRVKGGLNGTFLQERWYFYGLFSDITLIRSYFGDVTAHQLMIKGLIVWFLFSLCIPFILLYIFQILYTDSVFLFSTGIQTLIFAISFIIFSSTLKEIQSEFIQNFSDQKSSSIFRHQFKGPYKRNILTDEVNEFKQQQGFTVFLRNFACFVIFGLVLVMIGAVFHGCRMFLLQIYDGLYHLQTEYASVSHIAAYSIYLILSMIFQNKMYGRIVQFLIFIKNPSTQVIERDLRSFFTFYYLLFIQLIPIIFFFILEPFSGTSCYSISCENEFQRYVYAHFLLSSATIGVQLVKTTIFGRAKQKLLKLTEDKKQQQMESFQNRLKNIIKRSIEESKKEFYEQGLTQDIIGLFTFSFYCSQVPVAAIIAFAFVAVSYTTTRLTLLYDARRPINKSEPIIKFTSYCNSIYFCGLIINVWINTFLLNYVQRYYTLIIKWAPHPVNRDSIFLIKLFFTVVYMLVLSILSYIALKISTHLSPKTLIKRQHEKYRQYQGLVAAPKKGSHRYEESKPVKTIFRTFSPKKMHHQTLAKKLDDMDYYKQVEKIQNELVAHMMLMKTFSAVKIISERKDSSLPKGSQNKQIEQNQSGVRLIRKQM